MHIFQCISPLQHVRIDSDDDGECDDLLFPCESDVTDAAVVLLRKKLNGRYTLLKVKLHSYVIYHFYVKVQMSVECINMHTNSCIYNW